jgi:hypothetical protein
MESGSNAFHDFGALFFWDVRLEKDHGVLVFLIIHGGPSVFDDARTEDLWLGIQTLGWTCRFGG